MKPALQGLGLQYTETKPPTSKFPQFIPTEIPSLRVSMKLVKAKQQQHSIVPLPSPRSRTLATEITHSHVHLWPSSAANNDAHAWMHEGDHLAKQYSISDYLTASSSPSSSSTETANYEVKGFVYVETDRRYRKELAEGETVSDFTWAEQCRAENAFLRRIVSGETVDGVDEGFDSETAKMMKGCVLWAPVDRGLDVFKRWLDPGIRDKDAFERLVTDHGFVEVLRFMGKYHLCKPDMEHPPAENPKAHARFESWKTSITRLAACQKTYMKLSGAFSEMADQDPDHPWPVSKVVQRIRPWVAHVIAEFSPQRIMFGSDWPVCNVRGPGDAKSWRHWRDVVESLLQEQGLSEKQMDRVWYGTAEEAYKLEKEPVFG
ncbi:hypothetical protein FKW77_007192 [Venturia effusa]|uniref:Amidohydrolase-related domain-containing protein n=1 Tax=Venturia effusa TaxID=50376 RepID=A0A517L5P3_9PEZI|nr:hypothetical protein FKW77_007192 [Venturia effusa]